MVLKKTRFRYPRASSYLSELSNHDIHYFAKKYGYNKEWLKKTSIVYPKMNERIFEFLAGRISRKEKIPIERAQLKIKNKQFVLTDIRRISSKKKMGANELIDWLEMVWKTNYRKIRGHTVSLEYSFVQVMIDGPSNLVVRNTPYVTVKSMGEFITELITMVTVQTEYAAKSYGFSLSSVSSYMYGEHEWVIPELEGVTLYVK